MVLLSQPQALPTVLPRYGFVSLAIWIVLFSLRGFWIYYNHIPSPSRSPVTSTGTEMAAQKSYVHTLKFPPLRFRVVPLT